MIICKVGIYVQFPPYQTSSLCRKRNLLSCVRSHQSTYLRAHLWYLYLGLGTWVLTLYL